MSLNSQVQRSMYCYSYGKLEQRPGNEMLGVWYDQNGGVRSCGAALACAKGTALRNKYTFTMLLSVVIDQGRTATAGGVCCCHADK